MNEKLLNVTEVSNMLNISKSSIYSYAQEQTIPTIRLNGRLLFSKNALETWINSNTKDAINNQEGKK